MATDDAVVERVRQVLKRRKGISERKMFGGIAFMLNGNMVCGVNNKDLVLRLGDERAAKALMDLIRGKWISPARCSSMVYVSPAGYGSDDALNAWVQRPLDFAKTLPVK